MDSALSEQDSMQQVSNCMGRSTVRSRGSLGDFWSPIHAFGLGLLKSPIFQLLSLVFNEPAVQ